MAIYRPALHKKHPVFEVCGKKEIVKVVEKVHHIIPLSKWGTHNDYNLMSLCKSCHLKITAKEGWWWKNYKKLHQVTISEQK